MSDEVTLHGKEATGTTVDVLVDFVLRMTPAHGKAAGRFLAYLLSAEGRALHVEEFTFGRTGIRVRAFVGRGEPGTLQPPYRPLGERIAEHASALHAAWANALIAEGLPTRGERLAATGGGT